MSLDVVETIKSTFSQFKSETGLKILGAFLLVNLIVAGLTFGLTSQGVIASLSAVALIFASLGSIVLTIGAYRSLFEGSIEKKQFTEDIIMPFFRNLGSGAVLGLFTFIGFYVALVPLILIAGGANLFATPEMLTSLSPTIVTVAGIIGGAVALYPVLALVTSIPMIFIEKNRMFEALDKSVQRSSGEKLGMFFALLPVALLYAVAQLTTLTGLSGSTMSSINPTGMIISTVISSIATVASISLLVEYHKNLPEA